VKVGYYWLFVRFVVVEFALSQPEKQVNKRQTTMQKEYDLTQLKVKRRGLLADLPSSNDSPDQIAVNLLLDKDVVEFFQKSATQPNALPYQVQINQILRQVINNMQ
jgi:uncharacterized protein (DUF4415 family)